MMTFNVYFFWNASNKTQKAVSFHSIKHPLRFSLFSDNLIDHIIYWKFNTSQNKVHKNDKSIPRWPWKTTEQPWMTTYGNGKRKGSRPNGNPEKRHDLWMLFAKTIKSKWIRLTADSIFGYCKLLEIENWTNFIFSIAQLFDTF